MDDSRLETVKTLLYKGTLFKGGPDYEDELWLRGMAPALADALQDDIGGKVVTVRYWVTNEPCTKEQAEESFIRTLFGKAECEYEATYTELTGYLCTNEEIKIGGHDLLRELEGYIGKYLILEIEIHV